MSIDLLGIDFGHAIPLPQHLIRIGQRFDRLLSILRESVVAIMHDGSLVVIESVSVGCARLVLLEVPDGGRDDVFFKDLDMVISVFSGLFMPESDSMHHLVDGHTLALAARAERDHLSATNPANIRVAASAREEFHVVGFLGPRHETHTRLSVELINGKLDRGLEVVANPVTKDVGYCPTWPLANLQCIFSNSIW